MEFFEVGGCIRDELMGFKSKDVDFVVVGCTSFEQMMAELESQGFTPFEVKPEFVTASCGVPKGHSLRERTPTADFVMARQDGPSGDGRRPDTVEPGTLEQDLRRRDFRMNAIARHPATGAFIDPHGGTGDIARGLLRFVGDPLDRIAEDGLRVLRGFRFMVTKNVTPDEATGAALHSPLAVEMLKCVSVDRIRVEVNKMLAHDVRAALNVLDAMSTPMLDAIFRDDLRLDVKATTSTKRGAAGDKVPFKDKFPD